MKQPSRQRIIVQTKDVGFQIGARKTFDIPPQQAWNLLTSDAGIRLWLGDITGLRLEPGATYQTSDGAKGEVRVVKPGGHIRLTWQPQDWQQPSTIQVRVIPSNGKTAISFHQEHLLGPKQRERMQQRWYAVLEKIRALLNSSNPLAAPR